HIICFLLIYIHHKSMQHIGRIPCKAHRFSAMIRKVLSKLSIEIANLGRFNRSKQTTRFVAVIKLLTAQVSDVLIILMLRFIQIKTSNKQFPRGGN
ncbi:MAG: hypothetical protein WBJ46_08465, partial [Rectinema sp.]